MGLDTLADRPETPPAAPAGPGSADAPSRAGAAAAGTCGGRTTSKYTVPSGRPPCDADTLYLPGLESAPMGNGLSSWYGTEKWPPRVASADCSDLDESGSVTTTSTCLRSPDSANIWPVILTVTGVCLSRT